MERRNEGGWVSRVSGWKEWREIGGGLEREMKVNKERNQTNEIRNTSGCARSIHSFLILAPSSRSNSMPLNRFHLSQLVGAFSRCFFILSLDG